jgi:hypothetical protein
MQKRVSSVEQEEKEFARHTDGDSHLLRNCLLLFTFRSIATQRYRLRIAAIGATDGEIDRLGGTGGREPGT